MRRARAHIGGLSLFPRVAVVRLRWLTAVLFLACLGACSTLPVDAYYAGSSHDVEHQFSNIGSFVRPTATKEQYTEQALRMQLGLFRHARDAPPDHLLDEEGARQGLIRASASGLAVTWIGHSTALIRLGEKWVLTDPVFSDSVGFGPVRLRRLVPARPALTDLPAIDVIVVSHADYDHLDLPSLRRLALRNPETIVYVPLGNAALVRGAGFRNVRELDWFDGETVSGMEVQAVPAIHGMRRVPHKLDSMLWAGWILRSPEASVYFAGDTAYGSIFAEIRDRAGSVDLALVPIGAYEPRWFQEPFHTSPEEAALVAETLGAETAVGIHWGTFALSEEPPVEQKQRFLAASADVSRRALRVGETLILR